MRWRTIEKREAPAVIARINETGLGLFGDALVRGDLGDAGAKYSFMYEAAREVARSRGLYGNRDSPNYADVVKFQLARGWSPDKAGVLPPTVAGKRQMIEQLPFARATATGVDEYLGIAPIVWAAHRGHVRVAKLLLNAGANPNVTATLPPPPTRLLDDASGEPLRGSTALMAAVAGNHVEIASMLLEAGAAPEARRSDGKTATDLAIEAKNSKMAALLSAATKR